MKPKKPQFFFNYVSISSFFFTIFIFCISPNLSAQYEGDVLLHYKHDIKSANNSPIFNYGLELEVFVLDYLTINYNFNFGHYVDQDKFSIHAPAGFIVGPPSVIGGLFGCIGCLKDDGYWEYEWNYSAQQDDSIWVNTRTPEKTERCQKSSKRLALGILITLLPEGIGYQFPIIGDNLRFGPYINLVGMDFIHDNNTGNTDAVWSYGGGAKLIIADGSNFFNLSGFAELRGNSWEKFKGYYGMKLGFRLN